MAQHANDPDAEVIGIASGGPGGGGDSPLALFDRRVRRRCGIGLLGGIDEAGRGALAGPVVAACVVLAPGARLRGVDDSKLLTPERREAFVPRILDQAADWCVGWASAAEVDRINILEATRVAADRAVSRLVLLPQYLLTDYLKPLVPPCPFEALIDGDARSLAIAAASILAKVARDRIMTVLDGEYPCYGFASHKGYGTQRHWQALNMHGPSTLHRLSYNGVCFFDAMPNVRAVNRRPAMPVLPMCPAPAPETARWRVSLLPEPDWARVLTARLTDLDPRDFLPEGEWA